MCEVTGLSTYAEVNNRWLGFQGQILGMVEMSAIHQAAISGYFALPLITP